MTSSREKDRADDKKSVVTSHCNRVTFRLEMNTTHGDDDVIISDVTKKFSDLIVEEVSMKRLGVAQELVFVKL